MWTLGVASAVIAGLIASVFVILWRRVNRRLADPSMTRAQVVSATIVTLWVAHGTRADRGFFLLLIPIAFAFAIFKLGLRDLLVLSALTILAAAAEASVRVWELGSTVTVGADALHIAGLALMLVTLSIVGGTVNDFRRRTRLERRLAQIALERMGEGVLTLDATGRVLYMNALAEQLTGQKASAAVGHEADRVLPARRDKEPISWPDLQRRAAAMAPGEFLSGRGEVVTRPERTIEIEFTLSRFGQDTPDEEAAVLVFRDVTERTRLVAQLAHDATHDALTGFLNRAAFQTEMDRFIEAAGIHQRVHCVAVIDLDQFKVVNDVCGHVAGDQFLRLLAGRVRARVRHGDVIARLGGDEFGLILADVTAVEAATVVADLIAVIGDVRFTWNGRLFMVGASAGVASLGVPPYGRDAAIARADGACYLAKDLGRNRIQVYEERDEDVRQRREQMDWVSRLNHALEFGQFVLFAQRIVPIQPGLSPQPYLEILLRMRAEDGRLLSPVSFLPAAERFAVMNAIDRWVVRAALDTVVSMRRSHGAHWQGWPMLSINLSATSLTSPAIVREILDAVHEARIPAENLCFELTETAAVGNLEGASRAIADLRAIGCRIALDDVGTGFSSFGYLRALPVDYLKIDGSFVRTIHTDPVDRAVVESIQRIAEVLGVRTVAEYVEDVLLLPVLRQIGVGYAQGMGLHRPEPLVDVLRDLAVPASR